MVCILFRLLVVAIVFLVDIGGSMAREHPVLYWDVLGTVRDWKTKQGIPDALVLVLLNGSTHMNFGFNPAQSDYPDLPRTDMRGHFVAKAVLYQAARTKPKPETIELVVLAPGYRSEKFRMSSSEGSLSNLPNSQQVTVKDIELIKYDDLVDTELVSDASEACKLAQLAIRRKHLNVSKHELRQPESVENIILSNGRKVWRVAFALITRTKGGQIVVLIDCKTGKAEVGVGE